MDRKRLEQTSVGNKKRSKSITLGYVPKPHNRDSKARLSRTNMDIAVTSGGVKMKK